MKKATKAFAIDNGTVYEGQVLPDGHPAVVHYPEHFTDVLDDVTDADGAVSEASAPYGVTTDGTGETTVVDEPPAESAAAPVEHDDSTSTATS